MVKESLVLSTLKCVKLSLWLSEVEIPLKRLSSLILRLLAGSASGERRPRTSS